MSDIINLVGSGVCWYLERLGYFFYIAPPTKHSYKTLEEVPDYIDRVIPIFVSLIFFEAFVGAVFYKKSLYRLNDVVSSLASGVSRMLIGGFWRDVVQQMYIYVWDNHAIYRCAYDSWFTFFALLLLVEFAYYWFHRYAHVFHIMWVGHSTHHSGEDFNLATALRQGAFQSAFSWVFYLPFALFFPPSAYAVHADINTIAQFWFHTAIIGRLGPLEYILNTPSHHRMHHRPPGNCNYGGFLIIYDRMFGTFIPEEEHKDLYGLADPLGTFDMVWANVQHFWRIVQRVPPLPNAPSWLPNWVSAGCRRRAVHKLVIEPMALFKPIPPVKKGDWVIPQNPGRPKWDGAADIGFLPKFWLLINFFIVFLPLFLMVTHLRAKSLFVYVVSSLPLIIYLTIQGRILDARGGPYFVALMELTRTTLVSAFLYYGHIYIDSLTKNFEITQYSQLVSLSYFIVGLMVSSLIYANMNARQSNEKKNN